jgi:hypothetical protein
LIACNIALNGKPELKASEVSIWVMGLVMPCRHFEASEQLNVSFPTLKHAAK